MMRFMCHIITDISDVFYKHRTNVGPMSLNLQNTNIGPTLTQCHKNTNVGPMLSLCRILHTSDQCWANVRSLSLLNNVYLNLIRSSACLGVPGKRILHIVRFMCNRITDISDVFYKHRTNVGPTSLNLQNTNIGPTWIQCHKTSNVGPMLSLCRLSPTSDQCWANVRSLS